jgi:acyl carrier protein
MKVNNLSERLRVLVETRFPLARSVTNDDHLLARGIVDSLGILEVVNLIEHEFGISVSDDDLLPENFQSLSCLAAFVESKRREIS